MKIRVLILVIFLVAFGIQGASYGASLGFIIDETVESSINPTPLTKDTTTVDTTDIKFFLRVTKDFTDTFDVVSLTVEGGIAKAKISPDSFTMNAYEPESRALVTFTIPRTAITDAGPGEYEFTVTVTSVWPNVDPGSITLTLTVTDAGDKIPDRTIAIAGGNNQEDYVGEVLSYYLTVEVYDAATWDLYTDLEVTFGIVEQPTPNAGGATLGETSVLTDADGYASTTLTLGNAIGTYKVEASIGEADYDRVVFTATAIPSNSVTVTLENVDSLSQTTPTTETADVAYTLRVANTGSVRDTIDLTVSGDVADATLSQTSISLDAGASQDMTLTIPRTALTAAGTYNVTVTATSENDATVTAQITAKTIVTSGPSSETPAPDRQPEQTTHTVVFSEFMFESEGGENGLPQWIEVYNNSNLPINLRGWELHWKRMQPSLLEVTTTFKEDFTIPVQQSRLIVTSLGRHSEGGKLSDDTVYQLHLLHAEELAQNDIENRNRLIDRGGFSLKLTNPKDVLIDHIGTLTDDKQTWQLHECLVDGVRTSLIRRFDKGVPRSGTERRGWHRASDAKRLVASIYYGHQHDLGTPGYRRGKPLPVELSQFSARFVKDEVVINWTTESELNNAGFNVLRSTFRTKNFRPINTKLIQGAGTTGERNTYQFIDKTAKPNVAYYYRIEDIDFSGTRGILTTQRLRGTVSPTGKVITTWGTLKGNR